MGRPDPLGRVQSTTTKGPSMKEMQQVEVLGAIFPVAIKDNTAWTTQVIDIADADYVEFHVLIGATDIAVSAMKIQESDTKTNDTTLGGTPTDVLDVTTKPAATDDNKVWVLGVDCRKARKRYLQLQGTAGNGTVGTYMAATAVKRCLGTRGTSAAARNCGYVEYA